MNRYQAAKAREARYEQQLIAAGVPSASPNDNPKLETEAEFVARWRDLYCRVPSLQIIESRRESGLIR